MFLHVLALIFGLFWYQNVPMGSVAPTSGGGGGGWGATPFVQGCTSSPGDADHNGLNCTLPSNITNGNFLVACISHYYAYDGSELTVTWSGDGGTFVQDTVANGSVWGGTNSRLWCTHVLSAGGGGATISVVGTHHFNYPILIVGEFHPSGTVTTDGGDWLANGSGSTWTSNSITPTTSGDLIVGIGNNYAGATLTPGSGYTTSSQVTTSSNAGMMIWKVQATAAPVTTSISGASNYWIQTVAVYK